MNEYNNIDDLFRQKFSDADKLPDDVLWDKEKGWMKYEKKYFGKSRRLNLRIAAAACIALLILSGITFLLFKNLLVGGSFLSDSAKDAVKEINLPGGHHCFLAPESKVQYCVATKPNCADTLYLEGEVYLTTSQKNTLVIKTKNTITWAKGATFNLKAFKDDKTTVITSISGNIAARCKENDFPEMSIEAGESCSIYEGGLLTFKEPNQNPNFLAWKTGTLTFNDVPLNYAVKAIEEYYGVTIEIKSKDIRFCSFTSTFNKSKLDKVIDDIQSSFNLSATKVNNAIVLEGGECR